MNFLNSAILAGLAAALVPLLIHLLNRRQLKTVEFSSVMFLQDLRKTRMRRLQFRRWLLLLIRTLMIAMAVLAFARPALQSGVFSSLGSRARTTAVLALDRSASMALETQNGTADVRARRRLSETAELWGEGDEAIGLPFAGNDITATPPTAGVRALTDRLDQSPVVNSATDASAALTSALEALRESDNLNREIYFFTDLRRNGFMQSVVPPATPDDEDVTIYVVDVTEPGGFDLGVSSVAMGNQLIEPGSPFEVSATVQNNTASAVDRLLVSLFIDGRRVAQQETNLNGGGSATVEFVASVPNAGVHTGFVEISADDNPLNNQRHFALTIPSDLHILLASDDGRSQLAAALALSPDPTAQRLVVSQVRTDELIRENLFDYNCIIITEWAQPDRATVDHLLRFVRAGNGAFVAPAFDADTTAWNTLIAGPLFERRLGLLPDPPVPDRYFIWEDYDWGHPIWSVYDGVERDRIPEIRWHAIFRTEGNEPGRTLVRFSGGRPSLSEIELDAGKMLCLWSPMSPPFTNLPLRSIFVPFMHRLVGYCAADLQERRADFVVGEPIARELASKLPPETVLEIIAPDGSRVRPGIDRSAARVRLTLDQLEQTGVYRVVLPSEGDQSIDAFAVNMDPDESDPTTISRTELQQRLSGYSLIFVDPEQPLSAAVIETRYGTEVRPVFLWIVVALFFLEMLVARARRRDMPVMGHQVSDSPQPVAAN